MHNSWNTASEGGMTSSVQRLCAGDSLCHLARGRDGCGTAKSWHSFSIFWPLPEMRQSLSLKGRLQTWLSLLQFISLFFFSPQGFQFYIAENPNSKRKVAQRVVYQNCFSDPRPDVKEVNSATDRAAQWKRRKG